MDSSCSAAPTVSYHPVTMTINGVTKSVLVPLPRTFSHSRPVTVKQPDGNTVIIVPKSQSDEKTGNVLVSTGSSTSASVAVQCVATASAGLTTGTGSIRRPVITIRPIVSHQRLYEGRGTAVVLASPRLRLARAVTVQYPSGQRQFVPISTPPGGTCVGLTSPDEQPITTSVDKPVLLPARVYKPRPIILRKNHQPLTRSACMVVCPRVQSSSATSANSSSALVSSPRTLSQHEAIAAGWYVKDDVLQRKNVSSDCAIQTEDEPSPFAVRHVVPMDTRAADCEYDELKHSLAADSDQFTDKPLGGDSVNETAHEMKVIEIIPDNVDVDVSSELQREASAEDDLRQSLKVLKEEDEGDMQWSRQCSSVSTETAASEGEMSTLNTEDFVVLAEWTQDEMTPTTAVNTPASSHHTGCCPRRCKSRCSRRSSPRSTTVVYKARRSGGRPKTPAERLGIIDCFVSVPVLRLTRPRVDVRNVWRLKCCRNNEIQSCRCASTTPRSTDPVTARQLVENIGVVLPSLMACARSSTLPVQLSGPTSHDGVTPLVVRQPDGTLASVVAKRTTPGGTALDANKKKYLLIKAKTGSFLVPVDNPPAVTTLTAAEPPLKPPPSTSPTEMKPPAVSDTSGHRARIQQLKEQLRQQEEQLNSIRSQRAVQKFDLDSIRY